MTKLWQVSCVILVLSGTASMARGETNPVVSVTINGGVSADVFPGMPLLVSVWLIHPQAMDGSATPILISAQTGPWTNSVRLGITDASTNIQSWPFQAGAGFSNTLSLDSTNYGRVDWWLSPTKTLMLSTGQYTVVATLDTTGSSVPGAWQGTADSVPADLTIRDEPASLLEVEAENKYSQLAGYYLLTGDGTASLAQANALLSLYPTNITGLRLKAQALNALGQAEQAESSIDQALGEVFLRNPPPPEPPEDLYSLSRSLQEQRLAPPQLTVTVSNQVVLLAWVAYSEFFYWIESSTDQVHWSLLVANPGGDSYSFAAPSGGTQQYYRINRAEMGEVMAPPLLQASPSESQLTLIWYGYPWFNYRLEVSSDLAAWSLLSTNFNTVGNTYSLSVQQDVGSRFFRIVR